MDDLFDNPFRLPKDARTSPSVTITRERWNRVRAIAEAALRMDAALAGKLVEIEEQYVIAGVARSTDESKIALWSAIVGMGGIRPGDLADDV